MMTRLTKYANDVVRRRMIMAMTEVVNFCADYAQENHPWQNRSGMTTATTRGDLVKANLKEIIGAVSAGMDYDVFLELSRDGRWSWLFKALIENQETILMIFAKHGVMDAAVGLQGLTQSVTTVPGPGP